MVKVPKTHLVVKMSNTAIFKVSVSNYNKLVPRLILFTIGMILPPIFLGVSAANNWFKPSTEEFKFYLFSYLAIILLFTVILIMKSQRKVEIEIRREKIILQNEIPINFEEIAQFKTLNHRGYESFKLKLKDGQKWLIGPTNNFSKEAEQNYLMFKKEFIENYKKYQFLN